jgi:OmcA/MtrC family decaheme c-type cytochrome
MTRTTGSGFRRILLPLVLASVLGLVACEGDDGAPGAPGAPAGVDIANANQINAVINDVQIASPPVVSFSLSDGDGNPVKNLPADAISFDISKLVPGTDGNASAWQSYINQIEEPGVGPGTEAKAQAITENGAAGTLVDNNDGTYTYTFALDVANVTEPVPVSYVPTLTHRVSFEIRGFAPVRNPVYDFRPSDNATTGLFTREIADIDSCNRCHENLALHGGARFELQECVTCHNPGSADANSGNTVDMTVMTHKIHYGEDLPSVQGDGNYCIYGFMDFIHCYEDVIYPQDIRNCSGCHDADNPATPDASNWYEHPTDAACGACHDDVNFVTGENHGFDQGIPADNTQCIGCHASNPNSPIEVRQAHRRLAVEGAANYQFNIISVVFMGPGTAPVVNFSVTDPQNNDAPYDLDNDAVLKASPLRFYVAWNTVDYSNAGKALVNSQPESTDVYDNGALQAMGNGDLTYRLTLSSVAPSATGSGVVTFEGYVADSVGELPVTTAHKYFGITDDPMNPVPRRTSVDIDRCNDCHGLTARHDTRNDSIESCQVCHIADAARHDDPSLGPMDMKQFVHRIHAVDDIRYPQRVSNCRACHTDDGFYPVSAASGVLATSINRGAITTDPTDNNRVTANGAACGVCHRSADAALHMIQNGASFDACQEADGTVRERVDFCGTGGDKSGAPALETCVTCHDSGRSADVARAHHLE